MEMDLNAVIEKIKQDGVKEGEREAGEVKKQSEEKAKSIIENAEKKRDEIIKNAETEARQLKEKAEAGMRQAARDVKVALFSEIGKFLEGIIRARVSEALSPELLKDMIKKIVEASTSKDSYDLEILLSDKDKKALNGFLQDQMKKELAKGITIKVSENLKNGFRIGAKDNNLYYDFSDEAIAEAFDMYLNKNLKNILNNEG